MQAPTHILAGVIINRVFKWREYKAVGLALTFIFCLLVHAILDRISIAVYGPCEFNFNDPFWLIYHLVMWLTSIVLLYIFWREYKWGIIFSLLPGIDWIIIGMQHLFQFTIPFYSVPWIHFTMNYVLSFIPTNLLPDNRLNPFAVVWELLLIAFLAFIYRAMVRYRKNIHF